MKRYHNFSYIIWCKVFHVKHANLQDYPFYTDKNRVFKTVFKSISNLYIVCFMWVTKEIISQALVILINILALSYAIGIKSTLR